MYIDRHIQPKLTELLSQFPAVLLTGPRQVGKSTLLKHIAPDYDYLTLDDPLLLEHARRDPRLFLLNCTGKTIIDEVQYAPELFPLLKLTIDEQQQVGKFLLSGSQAFELMQQVSESLAGRVAILKLKGLSLREIYAETFTAPFIPTPEYLETRQQHLSDGYSSRVKLDSPMKADDADIDHPDSSLMRPTDIWKHIHRGDMPRLYGQTATPDWQIYYSSYVATYIERDVRQLTNIQNSSDFTRFMVSIAVRSGELLNYTNVANEVGVSSETIKRWLTILQTAGIVYLLPPYHNNRLKRAIKTPKVYMLDTGLMAYLSKWLTPETIQFGAKSGQFFETFVVSQIIKTFTNQGIEPPIYFYRDTHQKEIDLIVDHHQTLYPIEIKTTASPNAKMAKAFKVLDSFADMDKGIGVIISQYPDKRYLAEDLITLPIGWI